VELWLGSRTRGWNICRHRPAHTHTRDREPSDMVGRKRVSPTCHWGTDGRTGRGGAGGDCRHRPAHTHTRDREPSDMVGRKRVSPTCHWGTDGRTGRGDWPLPRARRPRQGRGQPARGGGRPASSCTNCAPTLMLHRSDFTLRGSHSPEW
jgi:hypothetical protein